jgi:hypothetical protein
MSRTKRCKGGRKEVENPGKRIILKRMTREYVKKTVAAVAVIVLALAMPFGGVCAMPCGSGGEGAGESCCCRPAATLAAEVVSSPSCCAPEVRTSDPGMLARAAVGSRFLELTAAAVCTAEEAAGVAGFQSPTPHVDSPGNARSSPLFLLHASFII